MVLSRLIRPIYLSRLCYWYMTAMWHLKNKVFHLNLSAQGYIVYYSMKCYEFFYTTFTISTKCSSNQYLIISAYDKILFFVSLFVYSRCIVEIDTCTLNTITYMIDMCQSKSVVKHKSGFPALGIIKKIQYASFFF